jgi:hypothetical protein
MSIHRTNKGDIRVHLDPLVGCLCKYSNKGLSGNAKLIMTHSATRKRRMLQWDHALPNDAASQAAYHLAINGIEVSQVIGLATGSILVIPNEYTDQFNSYMHD